MRFLDDDRAPKATGFLMLLLGLLLSIYGAAAGDWQAVGAGAGCLIAGAHLLGTVANPAAPVSVVNHHHATRTIPRGP